MKIVVDRSKCMTIGQCEAFAPEVFEINDAGDMQLRTETVPEGMEDAVDEAIECCPTEALSLEN